MTETTELRYYFHLHHDVLLELSWNIEERIDYIKATKSQTEQALRLALIKDVTEWMPNNKAWAAYFEARAAYVKARAAYVKARAAYFEARAANNKASVAYNKAWAAYFATFDVDAFHREHCHPNCPWDGKTIFSKGVDISVLDAVTA